MFYLSPRETGGAALPTQNSIKVVKLSQLKRTFSRTREQINRAIGYSKTAVKTK